MTSFSWQNFVSLCPASFCTPRPNLPVTPGISWLPNFLLLSPWWKGYSWHYCCSVAQSYLTLRPHGLQHVRLPCPLPSPRACSTLVILGKRTHRFLTPIWTNMLRICLLPHEKQLADQKSLSAKYGKLIQNSFNLKAPGHSARKHFHYSKQIILSAYKGAAAWSNHHS